MIATVFEERNGALANLERHGGGDHEEEQHAECPDIDGRPRVGVVVEEFRRGVRRRSAERGQHVALVLGAVDDPRRKAKVAEANALRRR